MNAADRLRDSQRARYRARTRAGLNTHTVDFLLFMSETEPRHYAGQRGTRHYIRLILDPFPEVTLKQQLSVDSNGLQTDSDAVLKGAFPLRLDGYEVAIDPTGEEESGSPIYRNYATPAAFRADIEAAESFRIDGAPYLFRSRGLLNADPFESEWTLRLQRNL